MFRQGSLEENLSNPPAGDERWHLTPAGTRRADHCFGVRGRDRLSECRPDKRPGGTRAARLAIRPQFDFDGDGVVGVADVGLLAQRAVQLPEGGAL